MQVIIGTRGMTVSRTYRDELTRKPATLAPRLPAVVETVDRAVHRVKRQVRETQVRYPRRAPRA